ncbi:CBN-SRE-21 protein [Caenorhabditis brenneri]|uniref:CBN-SRE-21 protein n=1 Tax=Caenorhabditis brenneri TaxID=135651 RepID=G0N0P4_CAEBE|nr:CBN-SRE-21 protein [Caenorhabditis brenneri]
MIQLFSSSTDVFSVKLATKEEVLDRSQDTGDVSIIWVFTFNSNKDSCIIELVLITFLLLVSMIVAFIGVFCIVYSKDYENKPRVWIAVCLIGANFLVSATYAFLAVSQLIMMKFVFTVCLVVTISSMFILETIYFLNKKRLAAIIRHDSTMVLYTLSTKYQLQENVQSCKLIRPAVITVGGFIILVILTECLPILLDFNDDLQAWCNLVFDTMVHINALVVVPTIILLMEGFRKVFLQQYRNIIQSIRPKMPARKKSIFIFSKRTENEGDVYFEMFNKSVSPISTRDKK